MQILFTIFIILLFLLIGFMIQGILWSLMSDCYDLDNFMNFDNYDISHWILQILWWLFCILAGLLIALTNPIV